VNALRVRLRDGPPAWLPGFVTIGVAAAVIVIGRIPGLPPPALALTDAVLIIALIVAAVLSPPLGVIAFVAGTLGSAVQFATETHTPIHFGLLAAPVLIAICALDALRRDDLELWGLPAVRAALALVIVAVVAAGIGNLPWFGFGRTAPARAQLGGIVVYALSAATFIIAADYLRDRRWLRRLVCVYLAVAAVMIGGRLMAELRDVSRWLTASRADGSLTWTWFAALGSAQVLFNRNLHWRWRVLLGLAVLGELYVGVQIDRTWLAGWIPAVVAIAVVVCLGAPRLGIPIVLLGAVAAALASSRVVARLTAGDNLYSLSTRLDAALIVLKMVAKNPIFGLGPANYYEVTPLFPIRGYAVNFSTHSTYVDLVAQTGIAGAACFAWMIWEIARAGWRARAQGSPNGFTHAFVIGALGGLVGSLVAGGLADWLFPFVYNVTLAGLRSSLPAWAFLGALVAVSRGPKQRRTGR
jgi:hypothetical protein